LQILMKSILFITGTLAVFVAAIHADDPGDFWAFQPLGQINPPTTQRSDWAQTPIDHFVLRRLEDHGLSPAPPATPRDLVRRVVYGLTGLPPMYDQIMKCENGELRQVLEEFVERLLESPRYGEHWGRHWLDVVRYAESAAHDGNNAYVHAWRYRDYVIQSFNEDKPYDQFIVEQLAGDLLPKTGDHKNDYDHVVATGFLQVGTKPVVMRDKQQMLLDIADELVNTTGIALMGMTIGCARCHDHKFDPISTADYYSMAGIFTSTHIMADEANDSMWLEYEIPDPDGQMVKVMAVKDLPEPADLAIHQRGSYRTLGPVVQRGVLQVISADNAFKPTGSGRLEMAHWIANPENPLTARVMVNRIWQYHFGRGLVSSSGNFGERGEQPSHPELLDWLARYFIDSGWSVKAMHRLILSSATYQQAHRFDKDAHELDSENRLLWRTPRRRLEGEEIRDSMLEVSGQLQLVDGGTLFTEGYNPVDASRGLFTVQVNDPITYSAFNQPVRSVFLPVIRNVPPEVLQVFDVANNHESTAVRSETTVAPQALFMLNSGFARRAGIRIAQSIVQAIPDSSAVTERIEKVFELVLGRRATSDEIQRGHQFVEHYAPHVSDGEVVMAIEAQIVSQRNEHDELAKAIRETKGLVEYLRLENIEFNGQDQRLEINPPAELNNPASELTVEYWVRPTENGLGFVIGRDGGSERLWKSGVISSTVNGNATNVVFYEFFNDPAGNFRSGSTKAFEAPTGQWTHVAFTKGNDKRRLFINGAKVDESPYTQPLPTGTIPISLGGRLGSGTEWLHGRLDHIAIYSQVLDKSTIQQHYELIVGTRPSEESVTKDVIVWQAYCQSLMCLNEFIYLE
jgi:hypothetical protein